MNHLESKIQEKLLRFVEAEKLFRPKEKILVAVSGGIDSMVLLHLLLKMDIECGIAHCNFRLRGRESDGDFEFVKATAEQRNIPFFSKSFDTKKHADRNKISIEMSARNLRYEWFKQICHTHKYQHVAIGHHADDAIETFFINLIRGTGIGGITGIKAGLGEIIRPLLPFSRKELYEYAKTENLQYREDSSNRDTDFVRNKIRHQLLPFLEELNPSIRNTMSNNILRFKEAELIYQTAIENEKSNLVSQQENGLKISISHLEKLKSPNLHLLEILSPYGFRYRDVQEITKSVQGISGKVFFSPSHRLVKEREHFMLSALEKPNTNEYLIKNECKNFQVPLKMETKFFNRTAQFKFSSGKQFAYLDADKLKFPLQLRHRKKGDRFKPIGMEGFKKLSDFFIDQKFSLFEKENTWLLLSNGQIVWVVGHRPDDRFKITDSTKNIFQISLK